ncbi:Abieta-7,13-dien-18-ol hydroxylase protein [Dioscorea alata]|uniref:Abieta-7,13-dien-18-ol hydroxylase protein n=2 Tax=Dioscorea alata TaxID=55571 RepID=A0ACB7WVK0_DIOAL|nr:Abieta-7,13-dien-18-ol hydroxylase protein [Dioscorea alata]
MELSSNLMASLVSIIISLLVFSSLYFIRIISREKKQWRIVKKKYPPIAATILHQLFYIKRLHHYQTKLSLIYKTFRLLDPIRNQIYTTDPTNIEYILRNNFKNYGKGDYNYENLKELFGDGIFAVDGEKWLHQRKLASYEFTKKKLREFSNIVFQKNASKLAAIVYQGAYSNESMDIQELFMRATMDSIFEIGFGLELNSLEGQSEGSQFTKAFDNSSEFTMLRYFNPFWKIKRFLNIGSEAKLKENIKVVDDFVYRLIHTKMKQMSDYQQKFSMKKEDILSRFLKERNKDPDNLTDKYLRDIMLNFLIAGKDTTAGTLSWFIYMLCKHPLVQERVYQDITDATEAGEKANFTEFSQSITDEVLNKMHYLHAALSETLRLYPAVPLDSKVCFSDDILPDGFSVNKGDIIFYQPYAMGRMKYLWGDDAEVFRPERWLDCHGVFQHESPFKFTAFQGGPRICLGKDFAYRQMKIFAAVLLNFFRFKLSEKNKVVNYRVMITLHIDHGLHVHAFHR